MLLVPGMVLTVEPMINMGARHVVLDPVDEWTIYTKMALYLHNGKKLY